MLYSESVPSNLICNFSPFVTPSKDSASTPVCVELDSVKENTHDVIKDEERCIITPHSVCKSSSLLLAQPHKWEVTQEQSFARHAHC